MNRAWFRYRGFVGLQLGHWQADVRDHRQSPPLFSARYGYEKCGHHLGPYCLRIGRLRSAASGPFVTTDQAEETP